jgi:glutamate carboxypeptidase
LIRALLVLLLLLAPASLQAQLSKQEAQAVAVIDREAGRHVALLERLVNQNSGTLNLPGVKAVADMLRPEFEALGMELKWLDMAAAGRAGHLVAHRPARTRGAKHILLIGHLDTVFEPDSPFQRFEREGERATGPGVVDMKGGNIVILAALRALREARLLDRVAITVFLTGDEERLGLPSPRLGAT